MSYMKNWIIVLPKPMSCKDAEQSFSHLGLNVLIYRSEGPSQKYNSAAF